MRAIVNTAPGRLVWKELPTPVPEKGQVLIRTGACGICATDIKMIAGWKRTGFPSIPGHEWAGTIAAVGPVVDGKMVGCPCVAENVLADGGEVGFEHPGGYGEYFVTEADKLQLLPLDFSLTRAALVEPLAVAVHGMARLRVQDKSRALVFGDGIIGLFFLAALRRAGVERVVVVGSRAARLALAEELGAARTLNYRAVQGDLATAVRQLDGKPFPNIVEASGSARAMQAAMDSVARSGHVLVVGELGEARADFLWDVLRVPELEVIGSNASAGAWPETVELATHGGLPLDRFISHRFAANEFEQAVELTRQRREDVVKVVLEW